MDDFIINSSGFEIIESHPELCFKYLNNGEVVLSKKSTDSGLRDRLDILRNYYQDAEKLYEMILNNTQRKSVAKDDIVDAICLCIVNQWSGKDKMKFIWDNNRADEKGIEMKIGYYDPRNE